MITEEKILKIEKAQKSLANFLMAMDIRFAYDYGTFYILDTHNPDKFINFCKRNNVSQSEIEKMVVSVTTYEEI